MQAHVGEDVGHMKTVECTPHLLSQVLANDCFLVESSIEGLEEPRPLIPEASCSEDMTVGLLPHRKRLAANEIVVEAHSLELPYPEVILCGII
jgi:hypothetical protein